jgi:hypothetical protein
MSGPLRVTPVADCLALLDVVAALQANEPTHADALMALMSTERCAVTGVAMVDTLVVLWASHTGQRPEDVLAMLRQWLELRQP